MTGGRQWLKTKQNKTKTDIPEQVPRTCHTTKVGGVEEVPEAQRVQKNVRRGILEPSVVAEAQESSRTVGAVPEVPEQI